MGLDRQTEGEGEARLSAAALGRDKEEEREGLTPALGHHDGLLLLGPACAAAAALPVAPPALAALAPTAAARLAPDEALVLERLALALAPALCVERIGRRVGRLSERRREGREVERVERPGRLLARRRRRRREGCELERAREAPVRARRRPGRERLALKEDAVAFAGGGRGREEDVTRARAADDLLERGQGRLGLERGRGRRRRREQERRRRGKEQDVEPGRLGLVGRLELGERRRRRRRVGRERQVGRAEERRALVRRRDGRVGADRQALGRLEDRVACRSRGASGGNSGGRQCSRRRKAGACVRPSQEDAPMKKTFEQISPPVLLMRCWTRAGRVWAPVVMYVVRGTIGGAARREAGSAGHGWELRPTRPGRVAHWRAPGRGGRRTIQPAGEQVLPLVAVAVGRCRPKEVAEDDAEREAVLRVQAPELGEERREVARGRAEGEAARNEVSSQRDGQA